MNHLHTIVQADVGAGVYRHAFGSHERTMLVRIHREFGGIMPADVGKRIFEDSQGRLMMERGRAPFDDGQHG